MGSAGRTGFLEQAPNSSTSKSQNTSIRTPGDLYLRPNLSVSGSPAQVDVVVAGSLAIDLSCDHIANEKSKGVQPRLRTSNPSSIRQNLGGVGANVATALHYMGMSVQLCSIVANDIAGSTALDTIAKRGLSGAGIRTLSTEDRTAQYVAVNDAEKNLVLAMADMGIMEQDDTDFDLTWRLQIEACKMKWVIVDANWGPSTIEKWLKSAKSLGAKTAFEPVSVAKAKRLFTRSFLAGSSSGIVPDPIVSLSTPNALELASMYESAKEAGFFETEEWFRTIDLFNLSSSGSRDKFTQLSNVTLVDQGLPQQSVQLLPFIPCILTTLGEHGVLLTQLLRPGDARLTSLISAPHILTRSTVGNDTVGGVYMRLLPPEERALASDVLSVNGVGDTFLGTMIAGLAKENPKELVKLVNLAQRASLMTLKSEEAVSPNIVELRTSF